MSSAKRFLMRLIMGVVLVCVVYLMVEMLCGALG